MGRGSWLAIVHGLQRMNCWWEYEMIQFSSVHSLSRVWIFVTPWTAACLASLSITNSWSWLKLMSIKLVMPSSHLIFCHPLLLLPSIFPRISFFSDESVLRVRCSHDEMSYIILFKIKKKIWYNQTSDNTLKKAVSLRYMHAYLHSTFFFITKRWRQPKFPLVDEEINKNPSHTHVMEY